MERDEAAQNCHCLAGGVGDRARERGLLHSLFVLLFQRGGGGGCVAQPFLQERCLMEVAEQKDQIISLHVTAQPLEDVGFYSFKAGGRRRAGAGL